MAGVIAITVTAIGGIIIAVTTGAKTFSAA
jgi:hypothetical protein